MCSIRREMQSRLDGYLSHDGSMVLLYMGTWIPLIYPSHVSIYTSTMDPMGIYIYISLLISRSSLKFWTIFKIYSILWNIYIEIRCNHCTICMRGRLHKKKKTWLPSIGSTSAVAFLCRTSGISKASGEGLGWKFHQIIHVGNKRSDVNLSDLVRRTWIDSDPSWGFMLSIAECWHRQQETIDIFRSLEEEGGGKTGFLHIFNLGDHPMCSFGESPHTKPLWHVQLSVPFLDTLQTLQDGAPQL